MFSDAFDFFELYYPMTKLQNHVIVFGRIDGFTDLL
jgi:hypothetical protein